MKKAIIILLFAILIWATFTAGYKQGVKHTILNAAITEDSDCYLLEIDGNIFEYSK